MPSAVKNRYLAALDPTQNQANRAQNFYLDKATSFDPSAAFERTANAAGQRFRRTVGDEVGKLRGQQVGMGRLDTGFATQDEDRIVTELGARQQEDLDANALNATSLDLRNTEGVGQYGISQGNTYLDLLSGQMDRETAEKNAKRQMWASILGGLTGAGGMFLGANPLSGAKAG